MASISEQPSGKSSQTLYQFSLQSSLHNGYFNVVADFAPVYALNGRKKLCSFSIIPHFNHDLKHYTNGFCTPYEGVYAGKQMALYQEKLNGALKSIGSSQINIPKPRQKNKRKCWVCFERFDDYLEHISCPLHKAKLESNLYRKLIKKLAFQFVNNKSKGLRITRSMTRSSRNRQSNHVQ